MSIDSILVCATTEEEVCKVKGKAPKHFPAPSRNSYTNIRKIEFFFTKMVSETITYPLGRISTRCIAKYYKGLYFFIKEYIKIF